MSNKTVQGYGELTLEAGEPKIKVEGKIAFNRGLIEFILRNEKSRKIIFTVKEDLEPKTNKQLGYYYAVVLKYAMIGYKGLGWLGYDKELADFELRMMFFADETVNEKTGDHKKRTKSLSDATKEDLSEYIENCITFIGSELGVPVPPSSKEVAEPISKKKKADK